MCLFVELWNALLVVNVYCVQVASQQAELQELHKEIAANTKALQKEKKLLLLARDRKLEVG